MTRIRAGVVVTEAGIVAPGQVEIDDGTIVTIGPTADGPEFDVLAPGFIDLQANGVGDVDLWAAEGSDWDRVDAALLAQGVTTWCPTLTSRALDEYGPALGRIARATARPERGPSMAGVHLEGPFLSAAFAGAHPIEALAPVDRAWLAGLPPMVKIVTLAPELDGALGAVGALAGRGVLVALGHSGASEQQARAAVDAGARMATHLFNGMAPLHHREPGLVGVALDDPRMTASVIADLVHVHPTALRVALAAKAPGRLALVTDAVSPLTPTLAGPLEHRGGVLRLADGTIAGSALTMNQAVTNLIEVAGASREQAMAAAATTPAALLGLEDRGRIAPGLRADLVALTNRGDVAGVWVGGQRRL